MQLGSISASTLAALAFASLPALAVDGVILIDQNKALAGNVTPGDAAGFPVTLSRPGSYRLSGNLTAPAGVHGFVIASPGVTLDLNGFAIRGPGDCSGIPPSCSGHLATVGVEVTSSEMDPKRPGVRRVVERTEVVNQRGETVLSLDHILIRWT